MKQYQKYKPCKDKNYHNTEHLDPIQSFIILNFLNTNEQKSTAVERQWITQKKTSELSQPVYLKDVLTSNGSLGMCCIGEEVRPLFPQEMKSYRFLQN